MLAFNLHMHMAFTKEFYHSQLATSLTAPGLLPMVPTAAMLSSLDNSKSLSEARIECLHHMPKAFSTKEFKGNYAPIDHNTKLPRRSKRGIQRRRLIICILAAADLVKTKRQRLLMKVTKEPEGKVVAAAIKLLWRSGGRLTSCIKRWAEKQHGGK